MGYEKRRVRSRTGFRFCGALFVSVGLAACGGNAPPPEPGQSRGFPPDLRGRRVIVLPVQQVVGVPGDPDAELAFALRDLTEDVDWIFEDEVAEILARSPAVQASTRRLPVSVFMQAEVDRVGDPLFGILRRMAALVDAEVILIPVQASYSMADRVEGTVPRVRIAAALVVPRTGRVAWFGVEEGGDFPQGDPGGLASAIENLARTLLWYVGD